jgi:cell wall-associated NlpC family hydrolase
MITEEKITIQDKLITIAESWMNTPYIQGARQKNRGIDCGNLILAIFQEAGLVNPLVKLPYLYKDWHRGKVENIDKNFFRNILLKFADIISFDEHDRGDVISFFYNNIESHVAVIVEDDCIIHAVSNHGVKKQRLKNYRNVCAVYRIKNGYGI